MRFPDDPRLPMASSPDFNKSLYSRLYELFRAVARQLNAVSEGRIVGTHNAATAAPTTGQHYQGDVVRNSAPVVDTGYIVYGWICVESGEPGTWKELKCATT